MISLRKGSMAVLSGFIAQYNAMRVDIAKARSQYHIDVTSAPTVFNSNSDVHTAAALTIASPNATNTATALVLAAEMATKVLAHLQDSVAHSTVDTAGVTAAKALVVPTNDTTTQTFASALQTLWNAHGSRASVHFTNDANTDGTAISSAATAWTSMNAIKALYNTHIASAPGGLVVALVSP